LAPPSERLYPINLLEQHPAVTEQLMSPQETIDHIRQLDTVAAVPVALTARIPEHWPVIYELVR
jgi:hypothetical protein